MRWQLGLNAIQWGFLKYQGQTLWTRAFLTKYYCNVGGKFIITSISFMPWESGESNQLFLIHKWLHNKRLSSNQVHAMHQTKPTMLLADWLLDQETDFAISDISTLRIDTLAFNTHLVFCAAKKNWRTSRQTIILLVSLYCTRKMKTSWRNSWLTLFSRFVHNLIKYYK